MNNLLRLKKPEKILRATLLKRGCANSVVGLELADQPHQGLCHTQNTIVILNHYGSSKTVVASVVAGPLWRVGGGGFGIPIWTRPSRFALFRPFRDFPDFFFPVIFPICPGSVGIFPIGPFPRSRPINIGCAPKGVVRQHSVLIRVLRRFWEGFWGRVLRRVLRKRGLFLWVLHLKKGF